MWQSARAGFPVDEDAWALQLALLRVARGEVEGARRRHLGGARTAPALRRIRRCSRGWHSTVRSPSSNTPTARVKDRSTSGARSARRSTPRCASAAYNEQLGAFVQSYDDTRLDASVLMIPLVGFLPADDPRVLSTIEVIRRDLTVDGLVRRYQPDGDVDGIGEPEGVFLACSFWMVDALCAIGRSRRGRRVVRPPPRPGERRRVVRRAVRPRNRRMLGNFPQAFTHLALVDAAEDLRPGTRMPRRRDRPDHEHGCGGTSSGRRTSLP